MTGILASLPPASILLVGALLLPLLRGRVRAAWTVLLPLLSAAQMFMMPAGESLRLSLFGQSLVLVRIDRLSLIFGAVFHLAALLAAIYALHEKDRVQQLATATYAATSIAGVFAGDLLTLFVFWELTGITSVFLIWSRRTERARRAGMRYLMVQVASGVLLLEERRLSSWELLLTRATAAESSADSGRSAAPRTPTSGS